MGDKGGPAGRRRVTELVVALAFLALAALVFQQTRTSFVEQEAASGGAMFNAAMFPELLAWCLVGLAAIQLLSIFRPRSFSPVEVPPDDASLDQHSIEPSERRSSLRKAFISLGLFLLYLVALKPLGYHLMTPLFMLAFFYALGSRNILLTALGAIAISLLMSFVFEYWMNVILPVGMFGIGF